MEILRLDHPLADLSAPTLLVAFDGWTDAGRGGTAAAETLLDQWAAEPVGEFDPDRLFDFRDRRPMVTIDSGVFGDPEWPTLQVFRLSPPASPPALLVSGAEPDLAWQALARDVVELAAGAGTVRSIGLGSVPGPVPHTRPVRVTATSNDPAALDRIGRPHERMIVPASCQVILETALRDAGVTTLGLWARIPHYVAGEYPDATRALLDRVGRELGAEISFVELDVDVADQRKRLDTAAADSSDVSEHVRTLEELYDQDEESGSGFGGPLPTGDEIAAELERFLRERGT